METLLLSKHVAKHREQKNINQVQQNNTDTRETEVREQENRINKTKNKPNTREQ